MPFRRLLPALVTILLFTIPAEAQQVSGSTQRDAQALAVLKNAVAAMDGSDAVAQVQSVIAQGSIVSTPGISDLSGNFTMDFVSGHGNPGRLSNGHTKKFAPHVANSRIALYTMSHFLFLSSPPVRPQSTVQDTAARKVIEAAARQTGLAATFPVDVVAVGHIIRPGGESLPIIIKRKGTQQLRIEIGGSIATTTVLNGILGRMDSPTGSSSLPLHSVISLQYASFPLLSEVLLPPQSVSLRYVRQELDQGRSFEHIALDQQIDPNDPTTHIKTRFHTEAWVDSNTGLLSKLIHGVIADNDPWSVLTHKRIFSDYRNVRGFVLPFHEDCYVEEHLWFSIQLDDISLNVGLNDQEFQVSEPNPQ